MFEVEKPQCKKKKQKNNSLHKEEQMHKVKNKNVAE